MLDNELRDVRDPPGIHAAAVAQAVVDRAGDRDVPPRAMKQPPRHLLGQRQQVTVQLVHVQQQRRVDEPPGVLEPLGQRQRRDAVDVDDVGPPVAQRGPRASASPPLQPRAERLPGAALNGSSSGPSRATAL